MAKVRVFPFFVDLYYIYFIESYLWGILIIIGLLFY